MGLPFIPVTPFPFNFDRKLRKVPYVTYSIMALNVLVYASMVQTTLSGNGGYYDRVIQDWGLKLSEPSFLDLFTHAFIHGGFFHLLGNMLMLWLCGCVLEEAIGGLMFALFYFTSMIVSVIIFGLIMRIFTPQDMSIPLVGASGAISGVMGLTAFRNYRLRVRTIPLLIILPLWFLPFWLPFWAYAAYFGLKELWEGIYSIAFSDGNDSVAHWAHIGGMALGCGIAWLFNSVSEGRRDYALEDAEKAELGEVSASATLQQLQTVSKDSPDDPAVIEAMAKLQHAQGQIEPARATYLRAIAACVKAHDAVRAASIYLNMLALFPGTVLDRRSQMTIAAALERLSRYYDACQLYDAVIEHYPDTDDAETALLRGAEIRIRHLEDPVTAEWMLRALVDDHPLSPWATTARARLKEMAK
jgi:membrane associated rhomboid family serine protease/TolA-binding protein